MIKELHEEFQSKGYILSTTVSCKNDYIDIAYDVPTLSKYLDFINLYSYDLNTAIESPYQTMVAAPLHPQTKAIGKDRYYTIEFALNYWLKKGADPNKLVS